MWNLENDTDDYLQSRNRDTDVGNKCMDTKEERGGVNWEIGIDIYMLLCVETLLYSTGNSTQCSAVT